MHFLNLPAILHFKLTNFLPLPAQELVVFPLNISGFLAYFSCCVILELGLCFQAGNRLGSHFGGTGRQEVALAVATNELNDNGDLKASDFYLNSLKFQELWRYSAQTRTSQLFGFFFFFLQGRYSSFIQEEGSVIISVAAGNDLLSPVVLSGLCTWPLRVLQMLSLLLPRLKNEPYKIIPLLS